MSLGTVGEAFASEVTFGKACIPGHRYIARLKTMCRAGGKERLASDAAVASQD